jgi:PAS domain S-box-containing protein
VLVVVGINVLIGSAVVIFNVYNSVRGTRERLDSTGQIYQSIAARLRFDHKGSDVEIAQRVARMLNTPVALLSRGGKVVFSTHGSVSRYLGKVYGGDEPTPGTRVMIAKDLADLSGGWTLRRFTQQHDLLIIVTRFPEEEGLLVYMTISAGLTGLGIAFSVFIMLAAANWMLHRPLSRLVNQLTGALAEDIQRRKDAEELAVAARQDAEEHLAFLNRLIDASEAVGIAATDVDGVIQIFNRAAVRILGYQVDEVVGKMSIAELRGKDPAGAREENALLVHPGEGEEFWAGRDGNRLLLYVNTSHITDAEAGPRGQLVTFIDVTERRQLEADLQLNELQLIQSAKLATLGEMATGIAHELNQPLNNIGLLASRLNRRLGRQKLERVDQDFYRDKLVKIQGQVVRAGKIIDHLRTFGRPTAKQLASVNVRQPVEGVMVFLREQLVRQGIDLAIELPEGLPPVLADEARLEQVLMNLILNARDALNELDEDDARARRIKVLAREIALNEGEPGIRIEVSDNGPGIPREVLDRIFEPFFTTKEVGKGTGLGLSISYGLVREFGGVLDVVSVQGEGTTFSIQLKQAPPRSSKSQSEGKVPNE